MDIRIEKGLRPMLWTIRAVLFFALITFSTLAPAQKVKLDGGWQFLPDPTGTQKLDEARGVKDWRNVKVGLSWNAQFAELRDYMGAAWYLRTFAAPQLTGGRRALLRFEAVDYFCEVYLNGRKVGEHEGGYTPFSFDITDAIRQGENEVAVRVVDPPMDESENRKLFPEMLYNEIPHGKQNWYVQTGGIWQPVWLEVKPKEYITRLQVTPKLDGTVSVQLFSNAALGPPPPAPRNSTPTTVRRQTILDRISVRVLDPSGSAFPLRLTGGGGMLTNDFVNFEGKIPNPRLWSAASPTLYTVDATLGDDHMTDRFGFRRFEARDGRFYLNGMPFYMIAALDQDFYPETIYTAPSKEYVRQQMLKAKQLGLNLLRCHIKVCQPEYLEAADEVGMLVWYEVPSWNDAHHFTLKAAARGEKTFDQMVDRDWNHPSIVIQSIINEGWGADLPNQLDSRRWLRTEYDRTKELTAPLGRLIVDNSACCDNFHLRTDIADNHRYNSIPDEHVPFDKWVADFASRPAWNFSPHGDAEPTDKEPLVLSEFGNWGLPKLPGELPWWFGRDFGGRAVTRPAGLFERFDEFKFSRIFRNYDALAEATQWHQFISLKHEIEEIRRHASIQGYVITEFTDINWEANGLLSMWREPKVYAAELAKLQQPDIVFARLPKYNFTEGERVQVDALLSHFSEPAGNNGGAVALKWSTSFGVAGNIDKKLKEGPGSVEPLGSFSFTLPRTGLTQRAKLSIQVNSAAGQRIAENSYDIFVYPRAKAASNRPVYFHDPKNQHAALATAMVTAGYKLAVKGKEPSPTTLVVSTALDDTVTKHLGNGGRAIIIADSKDALPDGTSLKITPREGSDLDGNWVTNFNWVRMDEPSPFSKVAFTNILGFESTAVVPRHVIQGIPGKNYTDVLSGIFYGWLNNNAALAVQMRLGSGKLLLTTFRFDKYGEDPYATRLLNSMIEYVQGPGFAPEFVYPTSGAAAAAAAVRSKSSY